MSDINIEEFPLLTSTHSQQAVYEHQRNIHPFQYLASTNYKDCRAKKPRRNNHREEAGDSIQGEIHTANHQADGEDYGDDDGDNENDGANADDDDAAQVSGPISRGERIISCHLCEEKLKDKRDYEDHVISAHGGDRCGSIGGGGGSSGSASTAKEELFFKKCPICSKSCKTPGLMKLHMRDAHSDPFARSVHRVKPCLGCIRSLVFVSFASVLTYFRVFFLQVRMRVLWAKV